MGNVDAIRRIIREAMAKRGRDSGPGCLLWFVLMDYLFVQAFCHYQHAQIEHRLGNFVSFKQFQMERKRTNSYRSFLKRLQKELTPSVVDAYFPGLRQQIDFIRSGPSSARAAAAAARPERATASAATGVTASGLASKPPSVKKQSINCSIQTMICFQCA